MYAERIAVDQFRRRRMDVAESSFVVRLPRRGNRMRMDGPISAYLARRPLHTLRGLPRLPVYARSPSLRVDEPRASETARIDELTNLETVVESACTVRLASRLKTGAGSVHSAAKTRAKLDRAMIANNRRDDGLLPLEREENPLRMDESRFHCDPVRGSTTKSQESRFRYIARQSCLSEVFSIA